MLSVEHQVVYNIQRIQHHTIYNNIIKYLKILYIVELQMNLASESRSDDLTRMTRRVQLAAPAPGCGPPARHSLPLSEST